MVFKTQRRGSEIVKANITLLPGDGIGPEVLAAGRSVLESIATSYGHTFKMREFLIGGSAIDAQGTALPEDTLKHVRMQMPSCWARLAVPNGMIQQLV